MTFPFAVIPQACQWLVLLFLPKSDWPVGVFESMRLRKDLAFLQNVNSTLISEVKGVAPNCWHEITPSGPATLFNLV